MLSTVLQKRTFLAAARLRNCAMMSVSSHPVSVPMVWKDGNPANPKAVAVHTGAANLEEWRKEQAAAGTPDPFHMLTAKERNAWVDDHENKTFNPTMTTPMGFRYGPQYPYNGTYGRNFCTTDGKPWPRMMGIGFGLSVRTLLACHPEVLKRESIGMIWILAVALLNNFLWAERDRQHAQEKEFYLSRASSDYKMGVNFGRKISQNS